MMGGVGFYTDRELEVRRSAGDNGPLGRFVARVNKIVSTVCDVWRVD
jgi:hypothetical protein